MRASLASLEGDLAGNHWNVLRSLLPLYQAITVVDLGNGMDSSFWYDAWFEEDAMADRFPAIHSHCKKKQLLVAQVLAAGLNEPSLFVPRLSPQAGAELQQLEDIVGQVVLNDTRDARRGPFCIAQGKLDSGSLYRLLQSKDAPPHPAAKFIWESRAPPRVQFFVWLLVHG
jgi:hypothetical protein